MKTTRILLAVLALWLALCVSAAAREIVASGDCSATIEDNVTWTLYDDGEIVIEGNGAMKDYLYQSGNDSDSPWNKVSIKSVTIGDGVTRVGEHAFISCPILTSVTIGNSVTSIGEGAFYGCSNSSLTRISIPNSVTSIGRSAFGFCRGLTSITIPDSVTYIGTSAFLGTPWFNNQPDGLIYAGKVAFKYKGTMPSGSSIVLKEGTKGIAGSAFYGCTGLKSITIPDSVTNIGAGAFDGCTNLTRVNISNIKSWCNISFYSSNANPLYYAHQLYLRDNLLTELFYPGKSVGKYVFYNCTSLTSVTIPDSVTDIETEAFSGCTKLKNIYYTGTEEQWNAIQKGNDWDNNTGSSGGYTLHCNYHLTPHYSFTSLSVLSPSFTPLSAIPAGAFVAEATVENVSYDGRVYVVLVSYDADGRLLETRYLYAGVPVGETASFGASFSNKNGNTATIKAFVWSSLADMTPLAESLSFPQS